MNHTEIHVHVWGVGYDETEELVAAISDLCAARGLYNTPDDREQQIRAMVIAKEPYTDEALNEEQLVRDATQDAAVICIPVDVGERGLLRVEEPGSDDTQEI